MKWTFLLEVIVVFGSIFGAASCSIGDASNVSYKEFPEPKDDLKLPADAPNQSLVLAGGCFWCTEGVFANVPGVTKVVSGYAGGSKETADYEAVCSGQTGHAEAILITYDPKKVTMGKLLKLFFSVAHDPTTLNRQGPDSGTQYRSAIFYANDDQKHVAEAYIKQLDDAKVFKDPIVTKLEQLTNFYTAEDYHQNYVKNHPDQGYIRQQALPKLEKLKKALESEPTTQPTDMK